MLVLKVILPRIIKYDKEEIAKLNTHHEKMNLYAIL